MTNGLNFLKLAEPAMRKGFNLEMILAKYHRSW